LFPASGRVGLSPALRGMAVPHVPLDGTPGTRLVPGHPGPLSEGASDGLGGFLVFRFAVASFTDPPVEIVEFFISLLLASGFLLTGQWFRVKERLEARFDLIVEVERSLVGVLEEGESSRWCAKSSPPKRLRPRLDRDGGFRRDDPCGVQCGKRRGVSGGCSSPVG